MKIIETCNTRRGDDFAPMRKLMPVILFVAIFALAACGATGSQNQQSAAGTFTVRDADNSSVTLSLADGPILFVAYWCSHCETYLKDSGLDELPTVVSVFPQAGDNLKSMVAQTRDKLNSTGWTDTTFFVAMNRLSGVEFTPSLAYLKDGKVVIANPFEMDPQTIKGLMGS